MQPAIHPLAPHALPPFVPGPDGADWFMTLTVFVLLGVLVAAGTLFLRLHTLPERMAHRSQKLQFEIVAVLGLLALFTHQHAFWVAGLLLALVDLPDISSPMKRMADALDRLAEIGRAGRADATRARRDPQTGLVEPADREVGSEARGREMRGGDMRGPAIGAAQTGGR